MFLFAIDIIKEVFADGVALTGRLSRNKTLKFWKESSVFSRSLSLGAGLLENYDPKPAAREQSQYPKDLPLNHKYAISFVLNSQDTFLDLLSV